MHAHNNGISPCSSLRVQEAFTKSIWIPRMRIDTDEKIEAATILRNCAVHSCALNPLRILHQYDATVACHVIPSDGTAAVGASPISNDDRLIAVVCVGQQLVDHATQMLFLVAARNDDQDQCRP